MMTPLARILLVEDDPGDVRLVLAGLAELNLGEQVFVVGDGVAAMSYLHARDAYGGRAPGYPAVVLLDLKLPGVDGLTVLEQIRSDPNLALIPVVILTSSRQERDLRRAYELDANGYVVKTIDFETWGDTVKSVGQYWAMVNEPPPGSLTRTNQRRSA